MVWLAARRPKRFRSLMVTMSAMWIALPYLGAARKARFFKTWRSEPWNM